MVIKLPVKEPEVVEEEVADEEVEEVFVFVPPTKDIVDEKEIKEFKVEEEQIEVKVKNLYAKITKADSLGKVVV